MKQLTLRRSLMGAALTAYATCLPAGIHVGIFGGTLPHIGAVSVVDPKGSITTQQFAHHRDGVVSERWARALVEAGCLPAVITAGIHYDGLSREQIAEVVALTDEMLEELLNSQHISCRGSGGQGSA